MASFRDYMRQTDEIKKENKNNEKSSNNEELETLINKYSKFSNSELMSEFMRMTYEKKMRGDLTTQELNNIKSTIVPFLNEEQKINLEKLINMVDDVR